MVKMLQGIAVVLVTIYMFALSQAWAQVPVAELHKGKCEMKNGDISPSDNGKPCKIMLDQSGKLYALIYADPPDTPVEVYEYDGTTKTFKSIWKVAKVKLTI